MSSNPKPIPQFSSEDEEREFWATHDSTEYIDWSKAVLLHSHIKHAGEPASVSDLKRALTYWTEHMQAHPVSPTEEQDNE